MGYMGSFRDMTGWCYRVHAAVKVVLGGEEQQVSDEDEGGAQDEGEEELDVDQVTSAVKSPKGGGDRSPHRTGYTDGGSLGDRSPQDNTLMLFKTKDVLQK